MGSAGGGDHALRLLPLQQIPTRNDEELEEMEVSGYNWPHSSSFRAASSPYLARESCAGTRQDIGNPLASRSTSREDQQNNCAVTHPDLEVGGSSFAPRDPLEITRVLKL